MIQTAALLLSALALMGVDSKPAASNPNDRTKLVFSIDQGFGNGVVVNRDMPAVRRMCRAMNSLRPQFDVYVVLNPQLADKSAVEATLDVLIREDMPFVLDVYSSDSQTLGTSTAHNAPADGVHGISITTEQLARYKEKYGRHLAGLRFMEVLSMDFTNRAVKTTNPEWNTAHWKVPEDAFFQPKFAKPFLEFARDKGMFVQWSDWHWSRFHGWDKPLKEQEDAIRALVREYPGTVILTYANNEPSNQSAARLNNWSEALESFRIPALAGIGLSDQAWLRDPETSCPIEEIIAWVESARRAGCRYIQFEPAWYFFKLPRGSFARADYKTDLQWSDAGTPLEAFNRLAASLKAK